MSQKKPTIIFMGTPEFAVPALDAIHEKFGVKAVVTVPDKPQGRGLKQKPSAIKMRALELDLPVLQPDSLKTDEFAAEIAALKPDIMVVIAFRILPPAIYKQAKIGAFNVHASLLPKYRGAAPINWAIINGDKSSGVTTFLLEEKVDTGSILIMKEAPIPSDSTTGDLHDFLMPLAANIAVQTCDMLISGNIKTMKQDDTLASPAPKLFADSCKIDWRQNAETVKNFIHGTSPHPGAWTNFDGGRVKIFRATTDEQNVCTAPGEYRINKERFIIKCGDNSLIVRELQPAGKRVMTIEEFLNGYRGPGYGTFES